LCREKGKWGAWGSEDSEEYGNQKKENREKGNGVAATFRRLFPIFYGIAA
jgi:hypothetical protein